MLGLTAVAASMAGAGRFLVVNQVPKPADAVIVLGGGPINRVARAAQWIRQRYAPIVPVSGGALYAPHLTEAQAMFREAVRMGVSPSQLLSDRHSTSTRNNAEDTLAIARRHHFYSLIVLSSNDHMRRVALLFGRMYRPYRIRLRYVAASDPWFHPNHWWSNATSIKLTVSEYLKLAYRRFETMPLAFDSTDQPRPTGTVLQLLKLMKREVSQ